MELLEAADLFAGWDYCIFHGAADDCGGGGSTVLPAGICDDHLHHCSEADFRRSGVRLAIPGVHYSIFKRRSVFLYRNTGAVSGQNLYGG